jgi:hypothetical protein
MEDGTYDWGRGRPADMRMVGQMTQWNQMMSFPITCTLAGQKPLALLSAGRA